MTERLSVIATIVAAPGAEAEVEALLRPMVAPTRAEPGCLRYELYRDADGAFVLFETYADKAAQEAHRATPHYKAYRAGIAGLLGQPIDVRLLHGLDAA